MVMRALGSLLVVGIVSVGCQSPQAKEVAVNATSETPDEAGARATALAEETRPR